MWTASCPGDPNNNAASSGCTKEEVVIGKSGPTIATTLSKSRAEVGTLINDSATLAHATSDAGGTATYTVYTDNSCSLGAQNAGTVTVASGLVPNSNPTTFNLYLQIRDPHNRPKPESVHVLPGRDGHTARDLYATAH